MSGTPLACILSRLVDARNRVAWDIRCVRCGYCLFGISHDTVCPECGVPVAGSVAAMARRMVRVDELAVIGDPAWLRQVTRAPSALLLALFIPCALVPVLSVTAALLLVALFVGIATRPEPGVQSEVRARARLLLLLPLIAVPLTLAVAYQVSSPSREWQVWSFSMVALLLTAPFPVQQTLAYLSQLAGRFPGGAHAAALRVWGWACLAMVPTGVVVVGAAWVVSSDRRSWEDSQLVVALIVLWAGLGIVIGLVLLAVLGELFGRLSYVARNAERLQQWHNTPQHPVASETAAPVPPVPPEDSRP